MRIGNKREKERQGFPTESLRRRQPPPDYTRRSTKMRVFAVVAALMVVLAFAERARDPKNWQWLWKLNEAAIEAEPKFTNRIQPQLLRTANDPEGTFVSEENPEGKPDEAAGGNAQNSTIDPVQRAWDQGWKDVYDRLDADRRTLLFQMFYCGTSHVSLAPDQQQAAGELLQAMSKLWEDYQSVAFQSVSQLTGDDQTLWVDVLRQVNGRFSNDLRPALQGVIDGRPLTESDERSLIALQQTLLALTRSQIDDDTVFRPAEREIWFYELARARDTAAEELKKQSLGQVTYLQLFNQPDDYRGQVITVEGTVRLAYRVQAPENYLGIKQYFVYWIHPSGGPTSPMVVYALEAPVGFPAIKDKDVDRTTTKLCEDVKVTGIFFKRWAYLAKDGNDTYTAPLLLAKSPQWNPAPQLVPATERLPMTLGNIGAVLGVTLALALIFGIVLYRRANARPPVDPAAPVADIAALRDLQVRPTPTESLREMERQARGGNLGE